MTTDIPDLWADEIQLDVLPPMMILRAQDAAIRRRTQGLLHAEIRTTSYSEGDEGWEDHAFDLVATAMNYRATLLVVVHKRDKVYPATISMPEPISWETKIPSVGTVAACYTADEFIEKLRVALRSQPTMATIATLIAHTNEKRIAGTP